MIMASAAPVWVDLIVSAASGAGTTLVLSVGRIVESLTRGGKVQVKMVGRTADGREMTVSGNDPSEVKDLLDDLLRQPEGDS